MGHLITIDLFRQFCFSLWCIVWPQCTASQTHRQTDRKNRHTRSSCQ